MIYIIYIFLHRFNRISFDPTHQNIKEIGNFWGTDKFNCQNGRICIHLTELFIDGASINQAHPEICVEH